MEDMAAAGTAAQLRSSDQSFTNCVSSPDKKGHLQAAVLSLWSQSTQHHPQTELTVVLKAPESHSPHRHLQAVVVT